ncbi:hypothetical protein F6Y02_43300 [Bacillus megaterium]|nr:hypothetical protein [Priestia megaterium]
MVTEDKTLIRVVRLPKQVDKMPIKMVWLLENVAKKRKDNKVKRINLEDDMK